MLETAVYLIVAYAVLLVAARPAYLAVRTTLRARQSGRTALLRLTINVALIVYVLLPVLPYGMVELQNMLLGARLERAVRAYRIADGDQPQIIYFEVLRAGYRTAQIYEVSPGPCAVPDGRGYEGCVENLVCRGRTWRVSPTAEGDDVLWTDCGSADGNVFPPFAAKADFP
jgi:hypothetical protein